MVHVLNSSLLYTYSVYIVQVSNCGLHADHRYTVLLNRVLDR